MVAQVLGKAFPDAILGPAEPVVARIRNLYRMEVILKLPRDAKTIAMARQMIGQQVSILQNDRVFRSVTVHVDVDPI
jgi:primosomal protein N' (replication factor Y) (superfamily II helicase)